VDGPRDDAGIGLAADRRAAQEHAPLDVSARVVAEPAAPDAGREAKRVGGRGPARALRAAADLVEHRRERVQRALDHAEAQAEQAPGLAPAHIAARRWRADDPPRLAARGVGRLDGDAPSVGLRDGERLRKVGAVVVAADRAVVADQLTLVAWERRRGGDGEERALG